MNGAKCWFCQGTTLVVKGSFLQCEDCRATISEIPNIPKASKQESFRPSTDGGIIEGGIIPADIETTKSKKRRKDGRGRKLFQ